MVQCGLTGMLTLYLLTKTLKTNYHKDMLKNLHVRREQGEVLKVADGLTSSFLGIGSINVVRWSHQSSLEVLPMGPTEIDRISEFAMWIFLSQLQTKNGRNIVTCCLGMEGRHVENICYFRHDIIPIFGSPCILKRKYA